MLLKNYLKYFALSITAYAFLGIIFFAYLIYTHNLHFLNNANFLRFDARLYQDIKDNGYHEKWLCAFFPAFPYFWRFSDFSAIGISIVNGAVFIAGISAIASVYKIEWKQHLFFLTVPSFIFMFVPYTE